MTSQHSEYAYAIIGMGIEGESFNDTNNGQSLRLSRAIETFAPGYGVRVVVGSWEGKKELALLVSLRHEMQRENAVKVWARGNKQEAILFLGDKRSNWHGRPAFLHWLDCGNTDSVGDLNAVSREVAESLPGYTFAPGLGNEPDEWFATQWFEPQA